MSLAKRLYITAESTGMLSEACTFGTAEVVALDNLRPGPHKFRRFVEGLVAGGYAFWEGDAASAGARKIDLSSPFAAARRKGWRQAGKVEGRAWGYVVDGAVATVWLKRGEGDWRLAEVPARRPFSYALVFYGGGSLVALVLLALSASAVIGFVRYTRERDDFLAATAHDLTTPLVGLRLHVARLCAGDGRRLDRVLQCAEGLCLHAAPSSRPAIRLRILQNFYYEAAKITIDSVGPF